MRAHEVRHAKSGDGHEHRANELQCGRSDTLKITNGSTPLALREVCVIHCVLLIFTNSCDTLSASIGISTYAAQALGDVVYVELPTVGLEVSKGDSIGAVESVKSASDIMTPVSGTVVEVNEKLEEKPGLINQSPEEDGWLAKIKVGEASEWESLMDAEGYRTFTEEAEDK